MSPNLHSGISLKARKGYPAVWENFKDFWAEPFREDMDAIGWFLWLGLIIVCVTIWALIFRHVAEGVK